MNHSTKFKEEEKMSQELIAAYVYEHDNGDECWDNIIEFYKTPKGFVRTYTEGYHRTKTVSEVSYQEIEEAMQRAHIEVDARYEHAKKYGWSHPFTRSGCKIIKELDASKAMEEEVALFKYSFGNGDYVFMTEQAASHKLQIGKIVAEYFGSKANSSYYSVMFGDGEIVEIPMTEFENTAKIFKQAAEEYNNGWIPCSERLPEENGNYLVQIEESDGTAVLSFMDVEHCNLDGKFLHDYIGEKNYRKVVAWQPLPAPYQPNKPRKRSKL